MVKIMILFLDFDGVLHPANPRRGLPPEINRPFSCLPRLESVLRAFPQVRLVISSSWREHRAWDDLLRPFAPDIAPRVVGATRVINQKWPPYSKHPRYDEIQAFLSDRGWENHPWVALDDDPGLYKPGLQNLIICNDGFYEEDEAVLRANLLDMARPDDR